MDLSWAFLAAGAWAQVVGSTAPDTGLLVPPVEPFPVQPPGVIGLSTAPAVSTAPGVSTGPLLQGGATGFPLPFDPALQPRTVPAGYSQPGAPFSAPLPSFTPAAGAAFGTPATSAPQGPPVQPPAPVQPPPTFTQPPPP